MASVSSLDQDMRQLRLARYTPQAASEVRTWIESTLHESLPPGDLLNALRDGVALCKLANLLLPPPGIKFKKSPMPFIQMENISHFLQACERPPLGLPAHDRFLTVDLYESKDPAQVLQCLGAFSRIANAVNPSRFPTTIGPKRPGAASPAVSATSVTNGGLSTSDYTRPRGPSSTSATSSISTTSTPFPSLSRPSPAARALSPTLTGDSVSTTATSTDARSPRPRKLLYGYMGGASQGNQGVSFGARRQITSAGPAVPSLAEKERRRREQEAEAERLRVQAEEAERQRRIEREAEEERERIEEERRWEQETRRLREEEKARVEQQKREWEEQERRWRDEEEARVRADKEAQQRVEAETKRQRAADDARLRGHYPPDPNARPRTSAAPAATETSLPPAPPSASACATSNASSKKQKNASGSTSSSVRNASANPPPETYPLPLIQPPTTHPTPRAPSPQESAASWVVGGDERELLRQQWQTHNDFTAPIPPRPLPDPDVVPPPPPKDPTPAPLSPRPLPAPPSAPTTSTPAMRPTPLKPTPPPPAPPSRTATAPLNFNPHPHLPPLHPSNPRASPFGAARPQPMASATPPQKPERFKSLLEREMERERERQREWEEAQMRGLGQQGGRGVRMVVGVLAVGGRGCWGRGRDRKGARGVVVEAYHLATK
ncbi:calponin [Coniosporium tulheliwenetii]|uniref:Calponin n=1 Tax=Coniosporium tulheliwenetii TaxID=3383036 RepID=A0ACC2Z065_9PEZI|nr:calponin [Cladosporium sp. JES 115]